ncbi:M20 family metallopeptidase [Nocardioides sp. HDW12B]|uniref:M20 metallopeptidase family protein n=1 Tax=Nocardioides sp. HDW12B TaxID=2714939 RepID=UPI001F0E61A0|nr:M20 family metallopeptidase [Nocardioides sp. HDW12B]
MPETTATEPENASLRLARELAPMMVELRRDVHRHPEIGNQLPRTQQAVIDALAPLDLEITRGLALTSVVAVLRGAAEPESGPRQVVLLRGDMDALPVDEEVGGDHRSLEPGVMHACGHDLHVAALVGAAHILSARREEIAGDVVLMFQPGEEGPGGAEPMVAEGLLDVAGRRVDAAYAWHAYSAEIPRGTWTSRPGSQYAAADELHVTVRGEGGHGSAPHRARDPITALCDMAVALQTAVTRSLDALDPVVITVGRIAGGTKENIIPDTAELEATVRTLSHQQRERVQQVVPRVLQGVAAAHGLAVDVDYRRGYPVTVNDDAEHAFAVGVVRDLFGDDAWRLKAEPELGAEDMSFVMNEVPGAYLVLGACPADDPETAPDNHSPRADFDDSVVPDAAAWLAEVAVRRLARPARGA